MLVKPKDTETERSTDMNYSPEVERMCTVTKGPKHGPAPIPEEGKWVKAYEIKDISGLSHGIGWCAPQQGACKLTLNVKDGIVQEALVETIGCSGMTHSAAMAAEILPGKTLLECLNTDLVCDAINVAMREIFKQLAYGRSQTAFSEGGLPIGAGLEDLGKGLRSQVGTMYSIGFILSDQTHVQFRWCRITCDIIAVLIGFLCGAVVGVGTVITAFCMGPLIKYFGDIIQKKIPLQFD
jgi:NifU-like protein involved in Fe-S cluster formation